MVGAARDGSVPLLGSIKWRLRRPVTAGEVAALAEARAVVPGAASARLLVVCPAGARDDAGADVVLGADDLIDAFLVPEFIHGDTGESQVPTDDGATSA